MTLSKLIRTSLAAGIFLAAGSSMAAIVNDPEDMPPGEGRETVFYMCSACHSMAIVTQQGLSRKRWDDVLDWMVEDQGMAELDEATRNEILDYLADHYDEDRTNN
ncbi:aldehyde dehydrogenase [Algihabitans albus]|uniref:aldehyde dehydrogenase n=1 Tax=Algihabitans albus TaxID=2164067 RepID=UPI000E5C78E1|nr:aldehyde dehydrogenase [Algihabitans albus]